MAEEYLTINKLMALCKEQIEKGNGDKIVTELKPDFYFGEVSYEPIDAIAKFITNREVKDIIRQRLYYEAGCEEGTDDWDFEFRLALESSGFSSYGNHDDDIYLLDQRTMDAIMYGEM